jgi:signal transduction histidine kinase
VSAVLPGVLRQIGKRFNALRLRHVIHLRLAVRGGLVTAGILLWLGTAIVVGVLLARERAQTLERAMRTTNAIALALEEHTARTFQAIDVTLAGIAESIRLVPGLRRNDPGFQEAMAARMHALHPYVRALYVVGPDGSIIHDTDYPQTPAVSLADRSYFQRHQQDPGLARSISAPLQSRSSLGWFLAASRPIGGGERFEGIAVAAVHPQYFEAVYRRMGLGDAERVALYHRDGVLVASHPPSRSIGESFADSPLFSVHLPQQYTGSYMTSSGIFSHERLVTYRSVEDIPMVIALSQSTDAILDIWERTAIGAAVAMAGLLVLLSLLILQVLRRLQLRDLARERHAQAEKLEALGHLTGGIAHDFNNLLVVMASSLPLIRHPKLDEAQREDALAAAERSVARGADLVRQLSAFARRRPMHVQSADLNALVKESLGMLHFAAGSGVEIATDLAPGLAPCLVDETELEVALVNLVVNAKDAMKGRGRVLLKTYDSGRICLSVEDDGAGMPEHVRRRAFEPYYSTKGEAGTGLGLSQVYGFMTQIGGEVDIQSQPGIGCKVRLLFPKAAS